MKRRTFLKTAAAGACYAAARPIQSSQLTGRVRADVSKLTASIDRRIYGQNLEFVARVMEGGIIAEPGSQALTYGNGFRADVRDALKQMGVARFRWPGGCFADAYDWRDGVGPTRLRKKNRMWDQPHIKAFEHLLGETKLTWGTDVNNNFGTPEFMAFCKGMGAEPSLTASMEPEGPEQAAAWVAYVRENFGSGAVPVWAVGNEQWNNFEHNTNANKPGRYVKRYLEWARAMRAADPAIKLVASGGDEQLYADWNRKLLEGIGREMDYLSCHVYAPNYIMKNSIPRDEAAYLALAGAYLYLEETLTRERETINSILGTPIPVALDEWNVLGTTVSFFRPDARHREAMAAAGMIHAIHRHADLVRIADQFAAVNSGAPELITDRDHMVRTPMFHVFKLYAAKTRESVAKSSVESPGFSTVKMAKLPARQSVPFLDASLTVGSGRETLFLINRHPREEMSVEIEIEGIKPGSDAQFEVVAGPDFMSENTFDRPDTVTSRVKTMKWPERIELPPLSVSALST
jgi:alpha-L-arabinofuranosidase